MTATTILSPIELPEPLLDMLDSDVKVVRAVGEAVAGAVLDRLEPEEDRWLRDIEWLRERIYSSTEPVSIALPNRRGIDKSGALGEISRRRSKKADWCLLLMLLTRKLRPDRVLELGSCVGISGAYLAAGLHLNGHGGLVTLEGAPALAERARLHLDELGLAGCAEVITGLFRDTLQPVLHRVGAVNLAFVDGHHDEQATQDYFDVLLDHLSRPAVVVFDDIRWSDGMTRAWEALARHPEVSVSVDLERVGICVTGLAGESQQAVELSSIARMRARRRRGSEAAPVRHRRLNWGCGRNAAPGWINVDRSPRDGADHVCGLTDRLPFPDESFDYTVGIHSLQEVPYPAVVPVLSELRRVLRPGGVLRLGLPDLQKLIGHWQAGRIEHLLIPDDDAMTPSGKLILHALWYGHTRMLFTPEFAGELLFKAGFSRVQHCPFGQSFSEWPEIAGLDNRETESFFVEAVR